MDHLGPGGSGGGGPGVALKGLYSASPTSAGQNGYGPCPTTGPVPLNPKPAPLI